MKILNTSDWHLDWRTHGVRRFGELSNAVDVTVESAFEEKVDLYLFTGDLADPDSGSCVLRCVELMLRTAVKLRAGGIPSMWIAGNHDVIEDGSGETTLTPLSAITGPDIILAERPGLYETRSVNVLALPFAATSHTYDPEQFLLEEAPSKGRPFILAGHLSVPGIIPGEETAEMPRGRDVLYPIEAMKKTKPLVAINGHYHRRQVSPDGVIIPGSLAQLTFNEEGNTPGFIILDL